MPWTDIPGYGLIELDTFAADVQPNRTWWPKTDWCVTGWPAGLDPPVCTPGWYPNFSEPFEVTARDGRLWIRPSFAEAGSEAEVELHLKGVNWSGFESGKHCPEELSVFGIDPYVRAEQAIKSGCQAASHPCYCWPLLLLLELQLYRILLSVLLIYF